MIELYDDSLIFRFPDVHPDAECNIHFQRTLRIPDDNQKYPLPPGLGQFPLTHVDDVEAKAPPSWVKHGGVFLPMYQSEAMWISFSSRRWSSASYPFAIKVAAGKINAITGDPWKNELSGIPQDYLVIPSQPWLDGFCVAKGLVRQFVAMPLNQGYTAEEQITARAKHGGLQIIVYPMKAAVYEEHKKEQERISRSGITMVGCMEMGLAPGGLMRQKLYEDRYGFDVWEKTVYSRCYVHIVNSLDYLTIADRAPPSKPPSAEDYTQAGLPWFEYYGGDLKGLQGSDKLANLDSVAAKAIKKGDAPPEKNKSVEPAAIVTLGGKGIVREGDY